MSYSAHLMRKEFSNPDLNLHPLPSLGLAGQDGTLSIGDDGVKQETTIIDWNSDNHIVRREIERVANLVLIHWDSASVIVRQEVVDGMTYEFHYIPTLANKIGIRKHGDTSSECFLCDDASPEAFQIENPVNRALKVNNYPFMDNSVLTSELDHSQTLSEEHLQASVKIANRYGLNLAYSGANSGASSPDHAHIHLFTTHIPLYDMEPSWIFSSDTLQQGYLPDYPAGVLVLESERPDILAKQAIYLMRRLGKLVVNFNLQYSFSNNRLFIFPRKSTTAEALGGIELGATSVSGVFQPDARGYTGSDIAEALEIIDARFKNINGETMKKAIEEMVTSKEFLFKCIMPLLESTI